MLKDSYFHTEKTKQKMRKNHADFSGKNHPQYGIHRSIETKLKISNNKERAKKISDALKGRKMDDEWREKNSVAHIGLYDGEKNPNWRGGISFEPYCFKFNEMLKELIRERDDRICQECGRTEKENGRKLTIHHVHYDKPNCEPDLIALCGGCNSSANFNRDYWEEHYMDKLYEQFSLNRHFEGDIQ